jgi:hypothetical protein
MPMTKLATRSTLRLLPAILLGAALLAVPAPASAKLDLCQKGIEKAGAKLQKLVTKSLQKCVDLYRKATVNEDPLTGASATCNVQLTKAVVFPDPAGTSALQQTKNALSGLTGNVPPACTDDDLLALGHLPQATFGDRWQRWVMLAGLGRAVNQQIQLVGDTVAAFTALQAAGGCPLCARVTAPPCVQQSCTLGAGTSATAYAPAAFSLALVGEVAIDVCQDSGVLPNEYALVGRAAKTINRALVLTESVCTRVSGAEGFVACTGSTAPKVSYTACEDHLVNAPDIDECAGVGVSCTAPETDPIPEHAGAQNGGACLGFSTAAPAAGSGFALATVEITLVNSGQKGADGIACTDDDTAGAPIVLNVPLTTATATGFVFDAVASSGNTIAPGAATGTAFSCPAIPAGNLAGAKLVGAATAMHGLCLTAACDDPATAADEGAVPIDTVTMFTLACQ